MEKYPNRLPLRRGSALTLMILMSVILTGLVMTIAWSATVQSQTTGAKIHSDLAYQAAESAGQVAVWQFKNNNTWRQTVAPTPLPTLAIGSDIFSYTINCTDAGATADLYWPMSEGTGYTTADTSGHGNTGSLIGGVSWTTQGKFGNALAFDGASGYVDAGNALSTNIVSSITMAAWVKMNTAAQDQKVGGNQDGVSGGYKMSVYATKVEFEVRDASNNYSLNRFVSGGTILNMGVWYHVTGVFNIQTGTIKTYVNGILDRTLTGIPATALTSTTGNFHMGREPWKTGAQTRFFNGTIDDVRVYARALSDQEIRTLANTSVQISATATLQSGGYPYPPTNAVAYICSAPTALPPVAPAVTVGDSWIPKAANVSGDVQVTGNVTGGSASTINGKLTYAGTFSDTNHYLTIKGTPTTPVRDTAVTPPIINYASIQSLAVSTFTGGTGQTFTFGYLDGQVNVFYINGNVTDPVIDTSQSGGTILISGNLTLTKDANYGSSGFPAFIVCQGSVNQTGGSLNLTGGLYVNGNWTHRDCTIYGDVSINGSITDNTVTSSTYVTGGIPWFDPRSSTAPTPQPLFFAACRGATP